MSKRGDTRKLIKALEEAGLIVEMNGGHYRVITTTGRQVATFGSTTSDHRATKNLYAHLKRQGIHVKGTHR